MTHKESKNKMINTLIFNIIIILIILVIVLFTNIVEIRNSECKIVNKTKTSLIVNKLPLIENKIETVEKLTKLEDSGIPFTYSKDWDENVGYLLAKIAMAEAESCSTETKELIILTILNRVWSNDFPNTVEDVIFQKVNGVAQFTPIINGRWDNVEPNADCWKALHNVEEAIYDKSQGCTFFEDCENSDNWHSQNLTLLFESGGIRFYK